MSGIASEIKSILKYPEYKKELNEQALEQFLSFQYSALEETFFKGIYRLEPGSFLRWKSGSIILEIQKYFEPSLQPEAGKTEREWLEAVDHVVKDSVKAHEIADVEVGTFLSGGVDSGLIASEFGGKRAYTVGFGQEKATTTRSSMHEAQPSSAALIIRAGESASRNSGRPYPKSSTTWMSPWVMPLQ